MSEDKLDSELPNGNKTWINYEDWKAMMKWKKKMEWNMLPKWLQRFLIDCKDLDKEKPKEDE